MNDLEPLSREFSRLYGIMKKLRHECPWDRNQTAESLRKYMLEEVYEAIDSIDRSDWSELTGELGDLLLQIVFQSEIAEEQGHFDLLEVIEHLNKKMIQRHPHVFGEVKVNSAKDVADNWEHIKLNQEGRTSLLAGVPKNSPALLRAQRIQEKASRVGFDWIDINDVFKKVEEEIRELAEAVGRRERENIREEFGDLLFSLVNLSRFLDIDAEDALRISINKFSARFEQIEKHFGNDHQQIKSASLEELDRIWEDIKDRSGD